MWNLFPRFGWIALLLLPLPACVSASSPSGYFVRGDWIDLQIHPLMTAFESSDEGWSTVQEVEAAGGAIVAHDPSRGRFAASFPDADSISAFRASQQTSPKEFPVFTSSHAANPCWSYGEITARILPEKSGDLMSRLQDFGLDYVQSSRFDPGLVLFRIANAAGGDVLELLPEISKIEGVLWAEPNFHGGHTLSMDPNRPDQLHLNVLEIEDAWAVTQGSPGVVAAVLDEGIDVDHPDLQGSLWTNPNEIMDGLDNDGNGFIDDFNGWDFIDNNNDIRPTDGGFLNAHGTGIAGLIAARKDNNIGVVGIAPQCRVMGLRLFNGSGYTGDFNASEAIRYAGRYAATANASWGGGPPSTTVMEAIDDLILSGRGGKGVPIFFAAGNSGGPPVNFPARYAWSVAVGETHVVADKLDLRHEDSSFDETLVITASLGNFSTDISGPGGFDFPSLDYSSQFVGTSFSTPVAVGVSALLFSVHPQLTAAEAILKLIETVDNPLGGIVHSDGFGRNIENGYGRVSASRAVRTGTGFIDDRFEPNDTLDQAPVVRVGAYPWLYMRGDLDFFAIDAVAGGEVRATIQYLSLFGDIGLELVNEAGGVVASGSVVPNQNTYTSSLTFVPPANARYWIKVSSLGSTPAPYTLRFSTRQSDDGFEPNQSIAQPTFLNPLGGQTYKGLVCNNDDFYNFSLDSGNTLYALVSFHHAEANLGIELQNMDGNPIQVADSVAAYGESVDPFVAPSETEVFLRVFNSGGQPNQEYSLHAAVLPTPPLTGGGIDDVFEDNDTVATAAVIGEGFYPRLVLDDFAGEEDDMYRISPTPGKSMRITIGWSGPVDLDIRVYDDRALVDPLNTPPIARSRFIAQQVESIHLPASSVPVDYWLQVGRPTPTGRSEYRMAVEFLDPVGPVETAFFRLCEGRIGTPVRPSALRDWRGTMFSNRASAYPGIGLWSGGADPLFYPGSDRLAVDASGGGIYFPDGGDRGELILGDVDFSLFARFRADSTSDRRVVAGIPSVWEAFIRPDHSLDFTAGTGPGSELFAGSGPSALPGVWQDVAFVWDRTAGMFRILASTENGPVEASAPIGARTITGVGDFHLGSGSGGVDGLGLIEQARLFRYALSLDDFRTLAVQSPPSHQGNWELYD